MRLFALAVLLVVPVLAQEPRRPRITGVAHVALWVHDVEKARAYHKDFLGYAEPFDLKDADGSLALTFIKIGDRQYIELFPEREPGGDRLNHIAFETDDAEALRVYLSSRGVAVPEKANRGRIGNTSFNVRDPEGHVVEFVQYEPGGWSALETGRFLPAEAISRSLRHVGILTGPLEPQLRFYRDVLGFRETWRGSRDGQVLNWVNLQVPDGSDYLELMLYREQPAPGQRGSQHHICLEVDDVKRAAQTLAGRAARVSYSRPLEVRTGINRRRQLNVFDPDGTRTELMEPGTVDGTPTPSSTAPPPEPPAATASAPDVEERVASLLRQMTLEEKLDLLGGVDGFFTRGVPRLGVPRFRMADGPMGVRNFGPATAMPGGIALAATWNTALAGRVGVQMGRDARAKGVHFLLGPGVNIYRAPMNGRNFEYYGEDPLLAGGYERNGTTPLFPFGHGLCYTSFAYANLTLTRPADRAGTQAGPLVDVSFDVRNTGARAGRDVAQVYVSERRPRLPRPPKELRAFAKVQLAPGETRRVTLGLDPRAFAYWDTASGGWRVDPGEFEVLVGRSSADVVLSGPVTLTPAEATRARERR